MKSVPVIQVRADATEQGIATAVGIRPDAPSNVRMAACLAVMVQMLEDLRSTSAQLGWTSEQLQAYLIEAHPKATLAEAHGCMSDFGNQVAQMLDAAVLPPAPPAGDHHD